MKSERREVNWSRYSKYLIRIGWYLTFQGWVCLVIDTYNIKPDFLKASLLFFMFAGVTFLLSCAVLLDDYPWKE